MQSASHVRRHYFQRPLSPVLNILAFNSHLTKLPRFSRSRSATFLSFFRFPVPRILQPKTELTFLKREKKKCDVSAYMYMLVDRGLKIFPGYAIPGD